MKIFLLISIEYFKPRRFKFCKINHKTIDRISDKCKMKYEFHINRPMQAFELKLNVLIARKPELIKVFGGSKAHPLMRKYSHLTIYLLINVHIENYKQL